MKPIYILCFLMLAGLMASCKRDAGSNVSADSIVGDSTGIETTPSTNESTNSNPSTTDGNGSQSKSTGDNKNGNTGGHDYTFLTYQMLRINGAYVAGKDPKEKPYQSQWVDLEPNGTFKWGKSKDLMYSGNWAYNHDSKILSLIPNDKNVKQSEWSVMYNDQMVVWVGTPTFGNNGTQIQLMRTTEFPQ